MELKELTYGIKTKDYEYLTYTDFQQFITKYTQNYGEYHFSRRWNLNKTWTTNFVTYKNLTISGVNKNRNNWYMYLPVGDRQVFIGRKRGYYIYGFSTFETQKLPGLKPYETWVDYPVGAVSFDGKSIEIPDKEKPQFCEDEHANDSEKSVNQLFDSEKLIADELTNKIIEENISRFANVENIAVFGEKINYYIKNEMMDITSVRTESERLSINWNEELNEIVLFLSNEGLETFLGDEKNFLFVKNQLTVEKVLEVYPQFIKYKSKIDIGNIIAEYVDAFEPDCYWREWKTREEDTFWDEVRRIIEYNIDQFERQTNQAEERKKIEQKLAKFSPAFFYEKFKKTNDTIYNLEKFNSKFLKEWQYLAQNSINDYENMKEGNYEEMYKNNISVDDVEKNCMLFEKRWLQKFYEVVDAVFHHFIVEDKLDYYISIFEKDIKDDELILDVDENTEKRFCKTDIEKKLDEKEKKEFQFYNFILNNMKDEMYSKKTVKLLSSFLYADKIIEYSKEVIATITTTGVLQENENEVKFQNFDNIVNFVKQSENSEFLITKAKKKRGSS